MLSRFLYASLIVLGISSGLFGDYAASTPSDSKLLPPGYAFSIWSVIYIAGLVLAYKIIRNQISFENPGVALISTGYFLSGLWIRLDSQPYAVAFIAVSTVVANVSAVNFLRKIQISRVLLNSLAAFAAWVTVATSLVAADALHISTASDLSTGIYLAVALTIAFALYLFFAPEYGYVGTIAWATFSLLFTRSVSGTPIFVVSAIGFLISVGLILSKAKVADVLKSGS
jgi:hypothetical protein